MFDRKNGKNLIKKFDDSVEGETDGRKEEDEL